MAKLQDGGEKPEGIAAPKSGPARRQVREIARLVAKLEAVGELEARRRRQLQAALEKGRKSKRHRQAVDRSVARVGVLIERLRTLARELDAPVPHVAKPSAAVKPKAASAASHGAASEPAPPARAAATPPARTAAATATAATATAATAAPQEATASTKPAARRPRPAKAP